MTTFVALGDSITLGVGDPIRIEDPAGGRGRRAWRGWAALLADGLCDPMLHVVAGNGACSSDVEREQLPRALQLRPDIASVVVGVNDTLRPNFDPERIGSAAAHTIGALRAAGADVLTMRLPDPGRMLGMPGVLARPLAQRAHEIFTDNTRHGPWANAFLLSPDGSTGYLLARTGGPYTLGYVLSVYDPRTGALIRTLHTWRNLQFQTGTEAIGGDRALIWGWVPNQATEVNLVTGAAGPYLPRALAKVAVTGVAW